jgi:hypothetical protein
MNKEQGGAEREEHEGDGTKGEEENDYGSDERDKEKRILMMKKQKMMAIMIDK